MVPPSLFHPPRRWRQLLRTLLLTHLHEARETGEKQEKPEEQEEQEKQEKHGGREERAVLARPDCACFFERRRRATSATPTPSSLAAGRPSAVARAGGASPTRSLHCCR